MGLDMLQALKMTHRMWVHSGLVRSSFFPLLSSFLHGTKAGRSVFRGRSERRSFSMSCCTLGRLLFSSFCLHEVSGHEVVIGSLSLSC